LSLSACTSQQEREPARKAAYSFGVDASYLQGASTEAVSESASSKVEEDAAATEPGIPGYRVLDTLDANVKTGFQQTIFAEQFSDAADLQVAAEDMPMREYLHYTFGKLLGVNYILDDAVKSDDAPVTLSLSDPISARRLFDLTHQLLLERGADIQFNDDVFLIHKAKKKGEATAVMAIGRTAQSVPQTSQEILQVVPLVYGINLSIERTLRDLMSVKITPDRDQSALFIRGGRREILRALELVELLDTPSNRGRHIGLISLTFLTAEEFTQNIKTLLEAEGVPIAATAESGKNVVTVPLPQLGAVAVFASSEPLLSRVRYWANIVDKPGKGTTKQYFIYNPRSARAADIGESLSALLGASVSSRGTRASSDIGGGSTGNAPSANRNIGVAADDLTMVVDERTNSLIFYTSGSSYQSIMPLLNELDVLPKQVMLDIIIAEVTLKDEFKFGVEWALQQSEVTLTTQGAFGATSIGGLGLVINGNKGPLNASLLETSSLVNVLSSPTLLVRDGVSANITVGSDISVVGATTIDPINSARQTTATEYRKTGVDVTVTPTINARGVVIMEVKQSISNSLPASTGAGGNPDIFERSINTEVVANSGQTVLLGGLISEDSSSGANGVPGVTKIPILGKLFEGSSDTASRTELVMLITPRVLENADAWEEVTSEFKSGLQFLNLK
jgi:general secretion pathway protein D